MPREATLVRALVELADNLVADFDVVELLSRLADNCIDVLDVSAAGIMLADPNGNLRVVASSSEAMRLLELFELQNREGPCLDCFRSGRPVVNQVVDAADTRWPTFLPRAQKAGFEAVHALPLRLRDSVIGALNLFHRDAGHLSPPDIEAGQALADIATIAILQNRSTSQAQDLNDQLTSALTNRIVIEQAKGMVAERETLDMDASFRLLRTYARSHNLRLAEVATSITTGSLVPAELHPLQHRS